MKRIALIISVLLICALANKVTGVALFGTFYNATNPYPERIRVYRESLGMEVAPEIENLPIMRLYDMSSIFVPFQNGDEHVTCGDRYYDMKSNEFISIDTSSGELVRYASKTSSDPLSRGMPGYESFGNDFSSKIGYYRYTQKLIGQSNAVKLRHYSDPHCKTKRENENYYLVRMSEEEAEKAGLIVPFDYIGGITRTQLAVTIKLIDELHHSGSVYSSFKGDGTCTPVYNPHDGSTT